MYSWLGLQNFTAVLKAPLAADEVTPVLRYDHAGRLCAGLSNGGHTYLSLSCPGGFEIVKATCQAGVIVLERGQDGTSAQPFPIGACVEYIMTGAAVNDLIEQYQACPEGCITVTIKSGATAPEGMVAVPYEHRIVLSGTPPFRLGTIVGPQWLIVELDAGEIRLSGTPDLAGTHNVEIPVYSCGALVPLFSGCITVVPGV